MKEDIAYTTITANVAAHSYMQGSALRATKTIRDHKTSLQEGSAAIIPIL